MSPSPTAGAAETPPTVEQAQAEIDAAKTRIAAAQGRIDQAQRDDALGTNWRASSAPKPEASDEGVPFSRINANLIVNRSVEWVDSRRHELHVAQKTYTHVSVAPQGEWIYRHDK